MSSEERGANESENQEGNEEESGVEKEEDDQDPESDESEFESADIRVRANPGLLSSPHNRSFTDL